MRNGGLTVMTGVSYEGLFKMLATGRFDGLNRAATEISEEFDRRKDLFPNLAIERHLLLHYPFPNCFWFPNTDEGRVRAERVRVGMREMLQDGSLRQLFDQYYGSMIAQLDLDHRRIIEIDNPLLGADEPLDDAKMWYRPGSLKQ
jgi:membrane-bound lytic murein transglycosylase MltF